MGGISRKRESQVAGQEVEEVTCNAYRTYRTAFLLGPPAALASPHTLPDAYRVFQGCRMILFPNNLPYECLLQHRFSATTLSTWTYTSSFPGSATFARVLPNKRLAILDGPARPLTRSRLISSARLPSGSFGDMN